MDYGRPAMKIGTALLTIGIAIGIAERVAAQTADEVVERSIAASGGRAAYAKLRSRLAKGSITLLTPAGEITGTVELLNEAPNKSRALIEVDLSSLGVGKTVFD